MATCIAAVELGNDVRLTNVTVLDQCPRCNWRFVAKEGDTHCPDCTNNPLWDREEDKIFAHENNIFQFIYQLKVVKQYYKISVNTKRD